MANNTISLQNQQLFDPGALAQAIPYIQNGLTYVSNNANIHPRDEAGNIIFQENSETNPLLIIEPVIPNIANQSVLRVVNTAFQYFKFPVISSVDIPEISIEDLQLDLSALQIDPAYARYKPSEDRTVPVQTIPAGILMDEVVEGLAQLNTNCYTVSKEVKNSGKDLLFRIKLTHNFSGDDTYGTVYFSLMKTGPQFDLNRKWRGEFASSTTITPVYNAIKEVNAKAWLALTNQRKSGAQNNQFRTPYSTWSNEFDSYEAQQLNPIPIDTTSLTSTQIEYIGKILALNPADVPDDNETDYKKKQTDLQTAYDAYNEAKQDALPVFGSIDKNTTQTVYINERIPNSEFEIGDIFQIGAYAGQEGHTILNNQSYWVITDADKSVDLWNQEIVE